MARRTTPPPPQPAQLTSEDMRNAIPKLERRITELKAIDVSTIQDRSEPRFRALEQKIDSTLVDILGSESLKYRKLGRVNLDRAGINVYGTPLHEVREGYAEGVAQTISDLQTIIDLFREKLEDSGETPTSRARRAFGDLDLHRGIADAAAQLFQDGHYANAVEDACKALDSLVKIKSGKYDLCGTSLMQTVFSLGSPILRFNDLASDSDRSEQQGMMFLYAGAMLALRNPRAHELIRDDPEQALEYIGFLSMLAKSLERARRK